MTVNGNGEKSAAVVLTDLDPQAAESVAAGLTAAGHTVHPLELDMTSEGDAVVVFDEAALPLGGIDVLLIDAGTLSGAIEDVAVNEFRRTLEVKLIGTFLCVRQAVSFLKEAEHAAIVCISSRAGIEGFPFLDSRLRLEVRRRRNRPDARHGAGGRRHPRHHRRARADRHPDPASLPRGRRRGTRSRHREGHPRGDQEVPSGRLASPRGAADGICFLASERAPYVSGVTVPIGGGARRNESTGPLSR